MPTRPRHWYQLSARAWVTWLVGGWVALHLCHALLVTLVPWNGALMIPANLSLVLVAPIAILTAFASVLVLVGELVRRRWLHALLLVVLAAATRLGMLALIGTSSEDATGMGKMVRAVYAELTGANWWGISLGLTAFVLLPLVLGSLRRDDRRAFTGVCLALVMLLVAGAGQATIQASDRNAEAYYQGQFAPLIAALDAHLKRHGSPPAELVDLVPDYLDELPARARRGFTPGGPRRIDYDSWYNGYRLEMSFRGGFLSSPKYHYSSWAGHWSRERQD